MIKYSRLNRRPRFKRPKKRQTPGTIRNVRMRELCTERELSPRVWDKQDEFEEVK